MPLKVDGLSAALPDWMRRDAEDTGRGEAERKKNNLTDARYEQLQAIPIVNLFVGAANCGRGFAMIEEGDFRMGLKCMATGAAAIASNVNPVVSLANLMIQVAIARGDLKDAGEL